MLEILNMEINNQSDYEQAKEKINRMHELGNIEFEQYRDLAGELISKYGQKFSNEYVAEDNDNEKSIVEKVIDELIPIIGDNAYDYTKIIEDKINQIRSNSNDDDLTDLDMIEDRGFLCSREFWDNYLNIMSPAMIKTRMTLAAVCNGKGIVEDKTLSELSSVLSVNSVTLSRGVKGLVEEELLEITNTKPRRYKLKQYDFQIGGKGGFVVPFHVAKQLVELNLTQIRPAMYIMCRNFHSPNNDYNSTSLHTITKVIKSDSYDQAYQVLQTLKDILLSDISLKEKGYRKGNYRVEYSFDYNYLGWNQEQPEYHHLLTIAKYVLEKMNITRSRNHIRQAINLLSNTSERVLEVVKQRCKDFKSKYNTVGFLKWMIDKTEEGYIYALE